MSIKDLLLLILCSIACVYDQNSGRIPNRFLLLAAPVVFFTRILTEGISALPSAFITGGVLLLCLFPLFLFRMVGAGDIKFLVLAAALLGWPDIKTYLLLLLVIAALFSVLILAKAKSFRARFTYFFTYLHRFLVTGVREPYRMGDEITARLPLGPSLILAAVIFIIQNK